MPSESEKREIFDRVLDRFGHVTPAQRMVLYLRVVHGYSRGEIARELVVSVKTVEKHLSNAAARLDRNLSQLREELFRDYARAEARAELTSPPP